jgi:hypothetical protein
LSGAEDKKSRGKDDHQLDGDGKSNFPGERGHAWLPYAARQCEIDMDQIKTSLQLKCAPNSARYQRGKFANETAANLLENGLAKGYNSFLLTGGTGQTNKTD